MTRFLMPLAIFLTIVVTLGAGLRHDPRELPSALIGKSAPKFSLPVLTAEPGARQTVKPQDLLGKVWILNVWASWCAACRTEHPVLVDFASRSEVPVYGLNYKDSPAAALQWLAQMGDPYVQSLVDADGRVGIDFGVYGVPETYIIDARGVVRYRQVGPVTPEVLERQIQPLLRQLAQGDNRA
ncbi:DsbE family thiol:disulfide interchange protein [Cupriavidus pauculus]|uniref:DsbE family thiol:disulfide interchange protein n=1 Tax=Cupriavidus pauculus TaxID=82633 RepID=UPI003857E5D8